MAALKMVVKVVVPAGASPKHMPVLAAQWLTHMLLCELDPSTVSSAPRNGQPLRKRRQASSTDDNSGMPVHVTI